MVSQGVPMMLMGDEMGQTQHGNNNAYCHDTELSWLDWTLLQKNADLFRFFKHCIAFRKVHPVFSNRWHLRNQDYVSSGYADVSWHGTLAWNADWSEHCRTLAFMLCGQHAKGGMAQDNTIYVATNAHWEGHDFELPGLPEEKRWHVFANTGANPPEDVGEPGAEPLLSDQHRIFVGPRSVVILVGK
jgi:glycogen operon protein